MPQSLVVPNCDPQLNFEIKQLDNQASAKTVEARFDLTAYYASSENLQKQGGNQPKANQPANAATTTNQPANAATTTNQAVQQAVTPNPRN